MTRRRYWLPVPLPPWLSRRLPVWWRVRRLARMMRRIDEVWEQNRQADWKRKVGS